MEIPQSISKPVLFFFNGDIGKASDWINTVNPMLGDVTPCSMLLGGKENELQKFIDEAMSHKKPVEEE